MNKVILAFVMMLLAGCSSTPVLTQQPIEVENEQLSEFWVPSRESTSFYPREDTTKFPTGHVKVRYLIDSNGEVFNAEVVESEPAGVWDRSALQLTRLLRYEAAESNPTKQPVYVSLQIEMNVD